jgi:hypothetical protein
MPDRFERALRAGSAHFAMTTQLDQPSNVRNRGERRHRRIIVTAVAAVLAVGGTAATAVAATRSPDGPPPAPAATATPTPGSPSATPPAATGGPVAPTGTPPAATRRPGTPPRSATGGQATGIEHCPTSAIDSASVTDGGAGGGNILTVVTVTYRGSVPCTLYGYPALVGTDVSTGHRETIPEGHGTWFDSDSKGYDTVVHPGQRVSFDMVTSVTDSGNRTTGYINVAIVTPNNVEVPIAGKVPDKTTNGYSVGLWYPAR